MENEVKKESSKTYFYYTLTFVAVLALIAVGASFAYYRLESSNQFGTSTLSGSLECINLTLSNEQSIGLSYKYPISDNKATTDNTVTPVSFTITNNCTKAINYSLVLSTMFKTDAVCTEYDEATETDVEKTGGDCYINDSKVRYLLVQNNERVNNPDYLTNIAPLDTASVAYQELVGDSSSSLATRYPDYTRKSIYNLSTNNQLAGNGGNISYKLYLWVDYYEGDSAMYPLGNGATHDTTFDGSTKNKKFAAGVSFTIDAESDSNNSQASSVLATSKVENLASTSADVITVDHSGNIDYRFVGTNPNNYVCLGETNSDGNCINSENLYRIIGSFNTESTIGGASEYRVKLIKNAPYNEYYWTGQTTAGDTNYVSSSGESSNPNNWIESVLNTSILNNTYYNSLDPVHKSMIGEAVWHLNGTETSEVNVGTVYASERPDVDPIGYVGKVGLMYASDYGYAMGSDCLESNLNSLISLCYSKNWLNSNYNEWLLTPIANNTNAFARLSTGVLGDSAVYEQSYSVRPTFYLNSNVKISDGNGSMEKPFKLEV